MTDSDSPAESPLAGYGDRIAEIEARNDRLAAENEALRDRLDELEPLQDRLDELEDRLDEGSDPPDAAGPPDPGDDTESDETEVSLSRRGALGALAALGLAGLGPGPAAAADPVPAADALQSTLEFGKSYSGSPSSGVGLELETPEKALVGKASDTSGFKFGIVGRSAANKGRGIAGYADATSGANFGVLGRTASPEGGGVFGFTGPSSGNVKGVLGVTDSPDGTGTLGFNNATSGSPAEGIRGETKSTDGRGVVGKATASSGATTGVYGTTTSTDGYGVVADGDSKTTGNHEVTGSMSVGTNVLSAYQSSSTQSVPSGSRTSLSFGGENTDDFDAWDGTFFSVPESGDYHVDCSVQWGNLTPDGTTTTLWISATGDKARVEAVYPANIGASKTLQGLGTTESISVDVAHDDSSDQSTLGGEPNTYLTITKVG